ncbi:hypothetical protein [Streptomyces sp. MUM 178J]|uniref:hypothetical protein n=1 Tax=Streptomyces sp. MUM 178J TaxID=2791991 RepID=UPI001F03311C|nr:hypothetical protein [Streptomyces sp. MUM 178J]WRQ80325.1 hypothetical protein I3F59_013720 [Streptomyces sp. MUM 178J]
MTATPNRFRTRRAVGVGVLLLVAVLAATLYACNGLSRNEEPAARKWAYLPVEEVPVQGASFHPQFLTSDGQTMVAVGNTRDEVANGMNLDAWYSTDGLHWQTGDLAEHSRSPGRWAEVSGLNRWGGGFFAVGVISNTEGITRMLGAVAWRSTDGKSWQSVDVPPHDSSLFTLPDLYSDGVNVYSHMGGDTMWRLAPDGSEWQEFPLDGADDCSYRDGAGPDGPGLVVYGHCSDGSMDQNGKPSTRPGILTIGKRGEVEEVSSRISPQLLFMTLGVARNGETLVAAAPAKGGDREPSPGSAPSDAIETVVSRSTDGGGNWSPGVSLPVERPVRSGSSTINRIVHTDGSFLALGKVHILSKVHPAIWESADGVEWSYRRLPAFAEEGLLSSAATVNGRTAVLAVHGTRGATAKGLFVDFTVPADASAPATSPSAETAPSTDPASLLGTWEGTVRNADSSLERNVSLTITPRPGRGPVTLDSLTGEITVGSLATCTAQLGKPTQPRDRGVTFAVPSPSFWPKTAVFERPYCPTVFEVRLNGDDRMLWSGDRGFEGTLTRSEPGTEDGPEPLGGYASR